MEKGDGFMWMDTGMVVLYLAVLIGIGFRGRVKDVKGFIAAGGRYGTFTIFASLSASYIGGGYSSGNAAEAFSGGIGMPLALFGFSLSTILIGRFLVPGCAGLKGGNRRRGNRTFLRQGGKGADRNILLCLLCRSSWGADGSNGAGV